MTSKILIGLSASVLALAACSHKTNDATNMSATDNGMMADNGMVADNRMAANDMNGMAANGMAAAPMPTTAQGFANMAAASDHFEIESSKMAKAQGQSSAVKSFADKMISAHTQSTAKLNGILAEMSPPMTADDTLSPMQQQTMISLKSLSGAAFDTAYAQAQVTGHQMTLDGLKAYAASGDNAKLKAFANQMIPIVTAHLNMAKGLK